MSFPHRNHAEIPGMVGIDLGTYNSAAAAAVGNRSVMLRAREGATDQGICFPSVVEFDEQGEPVQVGELARQSMPVYPERVVCGVKRLIGRPYRRAAETGDTTRFGYQTLPGPDGSCQIQVGPKIYSPTDITSLILQKIKQDAQADFNPLGREIQEAVITVPAYFDPFQKSETERAALDAGFQRVHLMPEPTAAASAYRLEVEQEDQYIVVIDLGAGTLDVTVALLFLDENGQLQTDEKGHGGDTALGGLDMDDAIIRYVVQEHRLARVLSGPQMKARLRFELEKAKIALSTQTSTQVAFAAGVQDVRFQLHRLELEAAVAPIVARCRGPIRVALEEAGLSPGDVVPCSAGRRAHDDARRSPYGAGRVSLQLAGRAGTEGHRRTWLSRASDGSGGPRRGAGQRGPHYAARLWDSAVRCLPRITAPTATLPLRGQIRLQSCRGTTDLLILVSCGRRLTPQHIVRSTCCWARSPLTIAHNLIVLSLPSTGSTRKTAS